MRLHWKRQRYDEVRSQLQELGWQLTITARDGRRDFSYSYPDLNLIFTTLTQVEAALLANWSAAVHPEHCVSDDDIESLAEVSFRAGVLNLPALLGRAPPVIVHEVSESVVSTASSMKQTN